MLFIIKLLSIIALVLFDVVGFIALFISIPMYDDYKKAREEGIMM